MRRIRGDAMSAIWAILGKGIAIAIAGGGAFMIADGEGDCAPVP